MAGKPSKYSYILEYIKVNFQTALEYKASFFMQVFGMILNDIALLFFWWVFFKNTGEIKGWNLNDVLTIYAIVATSFGFATGFFGNVFRIPSLIIKGELDFYLTIPKSPILHLLISKMSFSAWGDVLFGFIVYIFLVKASFANVLLFLVLSIIAGFTFIGFAVLVSVLTFYLQSAETLFSEMIESLITFSLYPVSIFPFAVKVILYTIIPAAFVGYIPAFILKEFSLKFFTLLTLVSFVFMTSGFYFFNKGLKKYSSGSLFGPRI